jgi:hypothetical protein
VNQKTTETDAAALDFVSFPKTRTDEFRILFSDACQKKKILLISRKGNYSSQTRNSADGE